MIEQFHLLRPLWLLSIIPALLLTLALWSARSSGANWRRAIAPELLTHLLDQQHERRVRWPWWLAFAGWLIGCIALAGPTWEKLPQPVLQNRDAVVVVLDLSLSMMAADVQPSRLQRARFKILDLLQQRREGLTGLVAYSGDAHVVTPLTDDTDTIANLVPALAPDMMPISGSDAVGGVAQALQLMQSSGVTRGRVLLLTDDIEEQDIDALVDAIGKTPHMLSILGIGTEQGAPIPVSNNQIFDGGTSGGGGFVKAPDGSIAVPRLHRERLQQVASRSGGIYRDLSADDSDLKTLLPDTLPQDSELHATEREFDQWRERGPWLVLLILPLAALAFRRGWLLVCLIALSTVITTPDVTAEEAHSAEQSNALMQRGAQLWRNLWSTPDQQAAQRLQQGDARGAAEQFSDPAWRASAQYRAGDYEQAAQNFANQRGPDGKTTADADYNRGNALARAGQLQQSIAAYDQALQKNPALEDAKANRKLVENLLKQQQNTEADSEPADQQQQQKDAQSNNQPSQNSGHPNQTQDGGDKSQQNAQRQSDQEKSKAEISGQQSQEKSANDEQQAMNREAADQQKKDGEQSNKSRQPAPRPPSDEKPTDESKTDDAQVAQDQQKLTPEQQRQQQVMEQWLRQIPDDPSGLLRRKFEYEHRQRARPDSSSGDRPLY